MPNKKIRNATPLEYGNIKFKSTLEKLVYKTLVESGLDVQYEPQTFTLWEGFKPTVPFYDRSKKTKNLELTDKKLIDIKYTPDFVVHYPPGIIAFIEAKGMENDVFYIKKKLFRSLLEEAAQNNNATYYPMYFEVYTKKNVLQAIQLIKDYAEELTRNQSSNN